MCYPSARRRSPCDLLTLFTLLRLAQALPLLIRAEHPDQAAEPGLLTLAELATRQRPPPHEARIPIRGQHQGEQGQGLSCQQWVHRTSTIVPRRAVGYPASPPTPR